jgi:heterodisulfide reductase subunit A
VSTFRSGVFAAGTCLGPKDIHDSVADGRAAAGLALGILSQDQITIDPIHPTISESLCDGCSICIEVCPAGAISLPDSKAVLDSTTCDICGLCVHSCPKNAIKVPNYNRDQILEQVKGILDEERETPQIIGFFQDEVAYSALDSVGVARLEYPSEISITRIPSTALIENSIILACLRYGADAILLCDRQGSPASEANEKRLEKIWTKLEDQDIDRQRVAYQSILLPSFRMLPEYLKSYVKKIKRIGVLDKDSRRRIMQQLDKRDNG